MFEAVCIWFVGLTKRSRPEPRFGPTTDLQRVGKAAVDDAAGAALYRKQIADGLNGDPRAAFKAHLLLRDMLGEIWLQPGTNASLWAEYKASPAVLLRIAGSDGRGEGV
jgi:hypothetical protein